MTETTTHTLTDFLLARLAEDEAEVSRWQEAMEQDETFAVGVPSWVIMAGGLKVPARVLADVEAKRRIVEPWRYGSGDEEDWHYGIHAEARRHALLALASVYADHPDFNPEWRV